MVAATGVNRALTKECWAACTPGYVCNHESGLCEPGECKPTCQEAQVCARVDGQLSCVDKGWVYNSNVQGQGPTLPSGGPPSASRRRTQRVIASVAPGPVTGCATPGSKEWFAESPQAPPEPGAKHADFVGVWSVANAPATAQSARPLIVTVDWFGRSSDAATQYRVVAESPVLSLEVWSELSPEPMRLDIESSSRDRIEMGGVEYRRENCTGAAPPAACCELPRATWVRLGPDEDSGGASPEQPLTHP